MATRKITNAGERILARRMTRQDGPALAVRLFRVAAAAADTTTLAQLTAPNYTGYADVELDDANWSTPETNADSRAAVEYDEIEFAYTDAASQAIHGAAIYETGTNAVAVIELFDDPIPIVGTNTLNYTPRLLVFDTADVVS